MRVRSVGVLLIAALVVVIATGVRRTESYTTHSGSRVPPAETDCFKAREVQIKEGKPLKAF